MPSTSTADVIFVNGPVITVNRNDDVVEALALRGRDILRVGSRAYVEQTRDRDTRIVDLGGRSLIPGFTDNHIHMTPSHPNAVDVGPERCRSIADIADRIAERVRETPPGEWVIGRDYLAARLAEGRDPNRHDLDPVSPNNPVGIFNRERMGWTFNTVGLRRIGVQDDTPDPFGGPMERDAQGRPLGPLWDNARLPIGAQFKRYSIDDLVTAYAWLSGELNRFGITAAVEAGLRDRTESTAWQRLQRERTPTLRVTLGPYAIFYDKWDPDCTAAKIFDTGFATGFGDRWLKLGALQIGIDGGVIGRTAALYEPYAHDPSGTDRGNFRVTQEVADDFMIRAQRANWQAGLVVNGDRGIACCLDAVAAAQRELGGSGHRHRLEHAYLWTPELMDRAAELGVVWNTQAGTVEVMGPESVYSQWGDRARYSFPYRSLMDRGVVISGGSDWTAGIYNPFIGLDVMVNHRFGPDAGGKVLNADERLTPLEALRVYTYNGAYSSFDEGERGSLEEGKLGDLAVLSADILSIPTTSIRDLQVDETYVDGRLVYTRDPSSMHRELPTYPVDLGRSQARAAPIA